MYLEYLTEDTFQSIFPNPGSLLLYFYPFCSSLLPNLLHLETLEVMSRTDTHRFLVRIRTQVSFRSSRTCIIIKFTHYLLGCQLNEYDIAYKDPSSNLSDITKQNSETECRAFCKLNHPKEAKYFTWVPPYFNGIYKEVELLSCFCKNLWSNHLLRGSPQRHAGARQLLLQPISYRDQDTRSIAPQH